jgi:hypothetical protein
VNRELKPLALFHDAYKPHSQNVIVFGKDIRDVRNAMVRAANLASADLQRSPAGSKGIFCTRD